MPGYFEVKATPIFPVNALSKCAVYQVTSPSAVAFAARSANSSSACAGACAMKAMKENMAADDRGDFISVLHRAGDRLTFGLAPEALPWRGELPPNDRT